MKDKGNYESQKKLWDKERIQVQTFRLCFCSLHHGFSHCGMCTTTGTPTLVYLQVTLIKNRNMKKDNKIFKSI
jgi:hypothetical protein